MHSRGVCTRVLQEAKVLKVMVAGAFAAFVVSGPLQHVGVFPQTAVGDLSKQAIKTVLGFTAKDAFAGCKGNGGFGGGGGKDFGDKQHGNKHGNKQNGNKHDFGDKHENKKDKKHGGKD
jgi:hypothetical protein